MGEITCNRTALRLDFRIGPHFSHGLLERLRALRFDKIVESCTYEPIEVFAQCRRRDRRDLMDQSAGQSNAAAHNSGSFLRSLHSHS